MILPAGLALPGSFAGAADGRPAEEPALDASGWAALAALGVLALAGCRAALRFRRRGRALRLDLAECRAALVAAEACETHAAVTDPLTGLPNRRALTDAFAARRSVLAERDLVLSLLLLDLDRFGSVNAVAGPEEGDRVLREVAGALVESSRAGDVAGRLGGDRFLLLLSSLRYGAAAPAVAARLSARIAAIGAAGPVVGPLTASAGCADIASADVPFAEALRRAEIALAAARRSGRGQVAVYSPALDRENARRRRLAAALSGAGEGAIVPLYRPRIDREHRIVGLHALAFWHRPDGALQPLEALLPVLPARMQAALADRLLDAAMAEAGTFGEAVRESVRLVLPVAAERLEGPDFAERLLDRALLAGVSPRRIEISPFGLAVPAGSALSRSLEALRHAGVAVTPGLDEASPAIVLPAPPWGGLRLGRALIRSAADDRKARALATALVRLATALDGVAVAEGVDSEDAAQLAWEIGCGCAEGDRFCRPLPAADVPALLARGIAA